MGVVLWGILALLVGGLFLVGIAWVERRTRARQLPKLAGPLPATSLQRLAWWTLGAGTLLAMAAAAVVVINGPQRTYDDDGVRMLFTLLILGVLAVFALLSMLTWRWVHGEGGRLDERDRVILGRASFAQPVAMMVTLAVWLVGLLESFHDQGAVPIYYLYLVFWSVVVMDLLALPVGILLGYRGRD